MLRIAIFGVDLALIAAVGVFGWLHGRPAGEPVGGASPPRMSEAQKRAQAREVTQALERLATDPDSLVAEQSRSQVGKGAREAIPRGSKVDPDEQSWSPDDNGGGVMAVTIESPGKRAVTYAAVMVKEPGGWKVLATFPASKTP
jgi:hypothetical protein